MKVFSEEEQKIYDSMNTPKFDLGQRERFILNLRHIKLMEKMSEEQEDKILRELILSSCSTLTQDQKDELNKMNPTEIDMDIFRNTLRLYIPEVVSDKNLPKLKRVKKGKKMKRNWFMTQRDQIIDLNEWSIFCINETLHNCLIVLKNSRDYEIVIADFEDRDDAKEYLIKIYEQLWDEEYQDLDEDLDDGITTTPFVWKRYGKLSEEAKNE